MVYYEQLNLFNQGDIYFVIPQKDNATYTCIKKFELKEDELSVL